MENLSEMTDSQAETIYGLAHEAYTHGNYTKAATIFNGLAIVKKDNQKYWLGLGAAQMMLKRYDKAIQAFLFAAALKPQEPEPYLHAAECFWHQGKREEALLILDSAKSVASQNEIRYKPLIDRIQLYREVWVQKEKI